TCAELDIPCTVLAVGVGHDGHGPEAAARAARHEAYARVLGDDEVMALAHHRDDQAETFLLRALRGSGPAGLAAMPAWRRCGRGWRTRPTGAPRLTATSCAPGCCRCCRHAGQVRLRRWHAVRRCRAKPRACWKEVTPTHSPRPPRAILPHSPAPH